MINRYGLRGTDELAVEMAAYLRRLNPPRGLGRYKHFRKISQLLFPDLEWNPWMEKQTHSLNDDNLLVRSADATFLAISWTGCGASGKTYTAALNAFIWWMVDPENSIVVITTTTKEMNRKRIWPRIFTLFNEAYENSGEKWGRLIDSRMIIESEKGGSDRAISCLAVAHGETSKAVANLQGQHAPRIMLIIDESTDTPEAIFQVVKNMRKGCQEFVLLAIGNAQSHLDPHGQVSEPKDGWKAIDRKSLFWPTRGVKQWDIEPGYCLRFPGWDSPNVKLGKTKYPYLYSYEDWQRSQVSADETNLYHWSFDEGFWLPDGYASTILTESMIDKYDLKGSFVFTSDVVNVAALDPAFGGDACQYVKGRLGRIDGGKKVILIDRYHALEMDMDSSEEVDFQIANRVIELNEIYQVKPQNFGMDSTGIGRGVAAIINTKQPGIIKVEFGGAPTDEAVSSSDNRPGKEVYDRRVTELHFHFQDLVVGGQLRGLNTTALIEFTCRKYTHDKRKYVLETKDEVKAKLRRSPDTSDAIVVLVEVARQSGLNPLGYGTPKRQKNSWLDATKHLRDIYAVEPELTVK